MFAAMFEHSHQVLLSRFSGTFTLEDVAQCDRVAMLILGREGPIRGIVDLTSVEEVALTRDQLATRARQPAIAAGQARFFVAAGGPGLDFAQIYAALQREFGTMEPQIVQALSEACALLGMTNPKFDPIELPWRN